MSAYAMVLLFILFYLFLSYECSFLLVVMGTAQDSSVI